MSVSVIPSRATVIGCAMIALAGAIALLAGAGLNMVVRWTGLTLLIASAFIAFDLALGLQQWRRAPLRVERSLPPALALGVARVLQLSIINEGTYPQRVLVFDEIDANLDFEGLLQLVMVPAGSRVEISYRVTPRRRGGAQFGWTQLRLRTPGGSFETLRRVGASQSLRVFPNFAAVARYAWLAGDRRLAQIGIKSYQQRGAGTDFKQIAEYQLGNSIRHVDWKATLRSGKPMVREFQDERDQCVIFLIDCGRRMRADEGADSIDGSHFDQVLNAVMLLSYVALKEGDEVGAMTFGTDETQQRRFAARKGGATLNLLMARLHDIEPGTSHSDYIAAAEQLLRVQRKRALVVVLTNFRDEDAAELKPALKLLRTRHLVMLASLRERVLRELSEGPLNEPTDSIDVAAAHLFEAARRDAFRSVTGQDALSVDVEPAQLPVALVNRYHAVKRAGLL